MVGREPCESFPLRSEFAQHNEGCLKNRFLDSNIEQLNIEIISLCIFV